MKIVYSYYVMDLLHTGHILMLKNSKAIAGPDGRLVVGIVSDEAVEKQKGRAPLLSFKERLELAQSIRYVDLVVQQNEYSPFENVKKIKPDILMESESHSDAQLTASRNLMNSIGGKTIIMPYYQGQSSTMIKNKSVSTI
ncbi:adenylyltransferase/cytidyltransferase family protein [Planktomarina sp.]|jgi:glycerol-3-phosphate cytidylyltransferase|nr:adenylyltransferase/cytidyltransferase family protein [Planktomarina sp.]